MPQSVPATVDFHGARLIVADIGGIPYVAIKPICEALTVDVQAQLRRIQRHPVLSKGAAITAVPTSGGLQDTVCLPLDKLNGWLFGITASRVKDPARRERLIQYQRECFDALAAHFGARAAAAAPAPAQVPLHAEAMVQARRVALDYFNAYRQAVQQGAALPGIGAVPDQVLHGLLAEALMRQCLLLSFDMSTGAVQSTPLPADACMVSFARDSARGIAERIPRHRLAAVAAAINERMADHLGALERLLAQQAQASGQKGGQP